MDKTCTLSDKELIEKATEWVSKLSKSGGQDWSLRVPVDFNHDPDMLFLELCKRVESQRQLIGELHEGLKALYNEYNSHVLNSRKTQHKFDHAWELLTKAESFLNQQ